MAPPNGIDLDALAKRLASMGIPPEFSQPLLEDPNLMERMLRTSNADAGWASQALGGSSSSDSSLSDMERQLKMMIATSTQERGLPPVKVPTRRKEELLRGFQVYREEESTGFEMKQTIIGMPWSYSQTGLTGLKRISLRDMLVRKTHKGYYVLGRVVSEISKINSINFIFEDPEGCATMLSIYNYPTAFQSKADAMHPIFRTGSVWAIREPTYKFSARGDNPMIRIDAPSDIVPIAFDDVLLQSVIWSTGATPSIPRPLDSVEECRRRGSREFKAQNWLAAAVCYTDGLRLDKDSIIMRLNRSEAYIRLGWYNSALYDADRAIGAGIEDAALLRKAIFRAAKSSYYISDYERTVEYADRLPGDKDCAEWKAKATSRMRESVSGQYDWCDLYRKSLDERSRPDIGDYCGPVEVKEGDDDRIRGLFSTRDVKLGELLLASKPIASHYTEDNPRHKNEIFKSLNLLTNEVTGRDRPAIIATIAQKMWDDEQLAALIRSMYAGPEGPPPSPFDPAVPKSTTCLIHPLKPSVNIDILRIEGAASFNAFSVEKIAPAKLKSREADSSEIGMALYGLASFCNHSCQPSARRTFFGDVITLRATRPIKQGEEITVEYVGGSGSLSVRDKLSRWKFRCNCIQCVADRADGMSNCSLREQIFSGWSSKEVDIAEAAKKLDQVRKTYSDTPERRSCGTKPALALAYHKYANALGLRARRGDLSYCIPSIEAEIKSLEAIGMRVTDKSTSGPSQKQTRLPIDVTRGPTHNPEQFAMITLHIVAAFNALGDIRRAKIWMKVVSWLNDIDTGGGSGLFKLRYAPILQEMELSHIADQAL